MSAADDGRLIPLAGLPRVNVDEFHVDVADAGRCVLRESPGE